MRTVVVIHNKNNAIATKIDEHLQKNQLLADL